MESLIGQIFNIQRMSIHDGPGIRTTVFLKGCPLHCAWCSNPESQNRRMQTLSGRPDSRPYPLADAVKACLRDRDFYEESTGGVTLSGGEPLIQAPFAFALLDALRSEGIHTAMETTGWSTKEVFDIALHKTDLFLFDIKHTDPEKHRVGTGVGNELIFANLSHAVAANAAILPRIPVIPGFNDTTMQAAAFARFLLAYHLDRVQLLPFHQMGDRKYKLLGIPYTFADQMPLYPEQLEGYRDVFLKQGIDAFFS